MKRYTVFALVAVLAATLFAGCRSRNSMPEPTVATAPPTRATTEATTHETTRETIHESTHETETHMNEGAIQDNTNESVEMLPEEGNMEGRMRGRIPSGH